MRLVSLFFILLLAGVVVAGCVSTDYNQPQTVSPTGVLTAAPTASPTTQTTFAPLVTSSSYVAPPPPPTVAPVTTPPGQDPIVGRWTLSANAQYTGNVVFKNDGFGNVEIDPIITGGDTSVVNPLINDNFQWTPVPSPYSTMSNYSIYFPDTNITTSVFLSGNTGQITGGVLPSGTSFVRTG